MTPLEQHLRKWMEKAILDFGMISPGDRVAVAVSGGKDSLTLFHLMRGPFVHASSDIRVDFIHVDTGFPGARPDALAEWAAERGEKLVVVSTTIYKDAIGKKKRPCFLCSRMRRKALLTAASELGCNKIALGHHRDDAVETFLMNTAFNREISTLTPVQPLFDGAFHIIRPLYYVRDRVTRRFAARQGFPNLEAPCPMHDESKRMFIRKLIAEMERERPKVTDSLFASLFRVKPDYLPPAPPDGKPPVSPPWI